MKKFFITIAIIVITMINFSLNAQNVGIGSSNFTPDNSAGLEIKFTDKGLLIPRVALTSATDATTIPSPATSLLVYNLGTGGLTPAGFYYWNGSQWVKFATGTGGSSLPTGTLGQTLRHDGSNWVANSFLYNNGTNIGINTTPASNAILDIVSQDKGINIPRMTYAQRNSISSPTEGMLIYNTDNHCFDYYYNGSWQSLCGNPSMNKKVYRYTNGSPQRYTNTSGSYQYVTVKCWGAGGGGNGNSNSDMGFGGGGGYVQGQVSLAPGDYLDIEPGEHGEVGGGGGASVVVHNSYGLIFVAAGGGGAGADGGSEGPSPANGGAGGGLTGLNGDNQSLSGYYANGGAGGTQSAGGAGGTASGPYPYCSGIAGSSLKGGESKSGSSCGNTYNGGDRDEGGTACSNGCGGSGGSGYYGGGGAGSVYTYRGGGGGGGSSYYKPWPATNYSFTVAGSGQIVGKSNDVDYQFNAGMGGNPRQPGSDGLVVLIIQ